MQMVNISVNTPNNQGLHFVKNDVESVVELVFSEEGDREEEGETTAGTVICAEEEVVHLFHKNGFGLHNHYIDSFLTKHKSLDRVIDLKEFITDITPPPPKQA